MQDSNGVTITPGATLLYTDTNAQRLVPCVAVKPSTFAGLYIVETRDATLLSVRGELLTVVK